MARLVLLIVPLPPRLRAAATSFSVRTVAMESIRMILTILVMVIGSTTATADSIESTESGGITLTPTHLPEVMPQQQGYFSSFL